jgi:hypothetical protein
MKNIPTLPKIVLNILFYLFYVFVISVIFSFVFPQILILLEKPILDPLDQIFYKVQVLIIVFVLIITIILRKYLYISLCSHNESIKKDLGTPWEWKIKIKKEEKVQKTVVTSEKKKKKEKKTLDGNEVFNDEMKIYMDKEIK